VSTQLPPGPRLPKLVQTLGFVLAPRQFLGACQRRYGGAVTLSTAFDGTFVMVFDPELVRQVFQGSGDGLHAGEANVLLEPFVGKRSVLLLDGDEHLRQRRLLLPAFHGRQLSRYEEVIRRAADAEIDGWPLEQPFALLPSMRALTLHVILQAVFGFEPGPAELELAERLRELLEPIGQPRSVLLLYRLARARVRRDSPELRRFLAGREAVDRLLRAEIGRRRELSDDELEARDDVLSALLLARDEDGGALTDDEIRDELMTLLLAGHETTANGLAWAFDLLLHDPEVLARARAGDDAYLDAVAKEALRVRPVIPAIGRVVRERPFQLGSWSIPVGIEINPSIRVIHGRADLYPQPASFRPERFLGDDAPDTYTWLPFGGGTRRCLGASFAALEMRMVLRRVLERAELRPASRKLERVQLRMIALAPRDGTRVIADRVRAADEVVSR